MATCKISCDAWRGVDTYVHTNTQDRLGVVCSAAHVLRIQVLPAG